MESHPFSLKLAVRFLILKRICASDGHSGGPKIDAVAALGEGICDRQSRWYHWIRRDYVPSAGWTKAHLVPADLRRGCQLVCFDFWQLALKA